MSTDSSPFVVPLSVDDVDIHRAALNTFSQSAQKLIEIRTAIDHALDNLPAEFDRARVYFKCPDPNDITTSNNTIHFNVDGSQATIRIDVRNLDASPPIYASCQEIIDKINSDDRFNAYPIGNSIVVETVKEGDNAYILVGSSDTAHEIFGYKGSGYIYDNFIRNYKRNDAPSLMRQHLDNAIKRLFEMTCDIQDIGPDHERG